MRIPRDISASYLTKKLRVFGYQVVRQDGSYIRLTTTLHGQHHLTVPNHSPIKLGTLRGILKAVAVYHDITLDEVVRKLFL